MHHATQAKFCRYTTAQSGKRYVQLILNIELSDSAWNRATLPVKNGIRWVTQVALPAYLSSIASSNNLIVQLFLPHRFHSTAGSNDQLFIDAVDMWRDLPLVGITMDKVLSATPNQAGITRLTAAPAPYTGAFLQALPCSSISTQFDDASLRIVIATQHGASACADCAPHTCICGVTDVKSSGIQGLSCRKSAGRIFRHNVLNDLIKRSLATAEISSKLEPISLSRSDGKRPDGISLMPWKQGRCLVWDVTSINQDILNTPANKILHWHAWQRMDEI